MSQERLIELIHMELDRETTPEESAELARALVDNPGGQRLQRELTEVVTLLQHSAEAEVPSELRNRVLDAIPHDLYTQEPSPQPQRYRPSFSFSSWFRYATVFGLGIVSGLLVFTAASRTDIDQTGFDTSRLSGTMGGQSSSGHYAEVGALEIPLESVDGSVRLFESDGALLAQVSLRSAAEIEWILHYGGSGITLAEIGTSPGGDLAVRNGEISVRQTGEAIYLLRFEQVGSLTAPPSFRILVGDQIAFEGIVPHSVGE